MPRQAGWFLAFVLSALCLNAAGEPMVPMGAQWRFLQSAVDAPPPAGWMKREFDDRQWRSAPSGLVLPDEDDGIRAVSRPRSYQRMRRAFWVEDTNAVRFLTLQVEHEEGFVAWLNGVQIARHRGVGVRRLKPAEQVPGRDDVMVIPVSVDISKFRTLLVPGENVLALEGPNTGENLSEFSIAASILVSFPRGPFLQNGTASSMQIIWRTPNGQPGNSVVEFGTTDALGMMVSNSALVSEHVMTLTGLVPDTEYYYRVSSDSGGGTNLVSAVSRFRTFKTAGPIKFLLVGDTGQGTPGQAAIANQMKIVPANLVIHCGDIVYGGFTDVSVGSRMFAYNSAQMKQVPFYFTIGNHDSQFLGLNDYLNAFYLPTNQLDGRETFYSFDCGDAHFVSLFQDGFGGYQWSATNQQYGWLSNDLAQSSKPWKFIFMHQPLRTSGAYSATSGASNHMMQVLLPLAEQFGVQCIFGGHDHNFQRFAPTNGVQSIVSGGGGAGVYSLGIRQPGASQFWSINHFCIVTVDNDAMTLQAMDSSGQVFDVMTLRRTLTPDVVHSSQWETPQIEATPADDGFGNITGQTFDFTGKPLPTKSGQFSDLGWAYVSNDSTNLYVGLKSVAIYPDNNVFLFIESPRVTGVSGLQGLGNGVLDPAGQGADGLDCLKNLAFTNFSPCIAAILGNEFGDGQFRSFARTNFPFNTGQGVFRLDAGFSDVSGCRLQQFNRSPQTSVVSDDEKADFVELAIPLAELGGLTPGDIIKIGVVVGGGAFNATNLTRRLDSATLGVFQSGSGFDAVLLTGAKVRIAPLPTIDSDGDGLLDQWEYLHDLNPFSAAGDDGADGDPDHDGYTNAQEQLAGTDPRDAGSVLKLRLNPLAPQRYAISWQAVIGRQYLIEYAGQSLSNFSNFTGSGWPRLAVSTNETYIDDQSTNAVPPTQRSYRVRLLP